MPLNIFYFDDDATQLEVFQKMFGDRYDVRTATTLAEARRVLAECAPDIIISDQKMPEIDGTEFLREAAAACPDSFRVLLTGAITVGDVLPQLGSGVVNFFAPKPWAEKDMGEMLERASAAALAAGRQRRERETRDDRGGERKPAWLILLGV